MNNVNSAVMSVSNAVCRSLYDNQIRCIQHGAFDNLRQLATLYDLLSLFRFIVHQMALVSF